MYIYIQTCRLNMIKLYANCDPRRGKPKTLNLPFVDSLRHTVYTRH